MFGVSHFSLFVRGRLLQIILSDYCNVSGTLLWNDWLPMEMGQWRWWKAISHLSWQFLHSCVQLRTYNSILHPLVVSSTAGCFQDSIRKLAFYFAVFKWPCQFQKSARDGFDRTESVKMYMNTCHYYQSEIDSGVFIHIALKKKIWLRMKQHY